MSCNVRYFSKFRLMEPEASMEGLLPSHLPRFKIEQQLALPLLHVVLTQACRLRRS